MGGRNNNDPRGMILTMEGRSPASAVVKTDPLRYRATAQRAGLQGIAAGLATAYMPTRQEDHLWLWHSRTGEQITVSFKAAEKQNFCTVTKNLYFSNWIFSLTSCSMHTTHSELLHLSGLGAVGVRGVLGVSGGVSCCWSGALGVDGPASCISFAVLGKAGGANMLWYTQSQQNITEKNPQMSPN